MTKVTPTLQEYLDKLTEFWAGFEPTTDAEHAAQVDIPMLVQAIEEVYEEHEEEVRAARSQGYLQGFEAARKRYERDGGAS